MAGSNFELAFLLLQSVFGGFSTVCHNILGINTSILPILLFSYC